MSTPEERDEVASWAIVMFSSGSSIGDLIESAQYTGRAWDLPMSPQEFADKWADTIERLSEAVFGYVLHKVPQEPIKLGTWQQQPTQTYKYGKG